MTVKPTANQGGSAKRDRAQKIGGHPAPATTSRHFRSSPSSSVRRNAGDKRQQQMPSTISRR